MGNPLCSSADIYAHTSNGVGASSGDEGGFEAYAAKIRTARESLGWTRSQLAETCGLTRRTVTRLELADGRPNQRALAAMTAALEAAGVMVTGSDKLSVKLRRTPKSDD